MGSVYSRLESKERNSSLHVWAKQNTPWVRSDKCVTGLQAGLDSNSGMQVSSRGPGCVLLSYICLLLCRSLHCYDSPLPTIGDWKHQIFQPCHSAGRTWPGDLAIFPGSPGQPESEVPHLLNPTMRNISKEQFPRIGPRASWHALNAS